MGVSGAWGQENLGKFSAGGGTEFTEEESQPVNTKIPDSNRNQSRDTERWQPA